MAIDLTGIANENEFYTHHYLSAILENDLREVFQKWEQEAREGDGRPPYDQLRSLHKDFFSLRSLLERERGPEARLEAQREFLKKLLPTLGYEFDIEVKELDTGERIPVIHEARRPNGAPELWIIEVLETSGDGVDPLSLPLAACQYPAGEIPAQPLLELPLEETVSRLVFGRSEPPRRVILASDTQLVLLDRGKWSEKRLLRFDLAEILGRREPSTLRAAAALLHRESLCPAEGQSLLDSLDENSHRHAFAVSEDLKYALREAIELLGNEAVWYLTEVRKKGVYSGEEKLDAKQLTVECLRYMYRLLFLFYIEARPELGFSPMKADAYRAGLSLEFLRDLELVNLTNEEARNGHFLHESIELLFDLIYNGFPRDRYEQAELSFEAGGEQAAPDHHTFRIAPLKSHLFDPSRTPLLARVKFRNSVLQRVIELMSLSRVRGGRQRRGRISYSQLGINQLGAVYEALLSYQGFFAETDLYEVKRADEEVNELEIAYFVKAGDLAQYTDEERVYNEDGTLRKYPKGTFIYRLAGRDREKSASYYTPEVLTRCLVKYALKELLKDKRADEILSLTICEPAMGSAAFLNEAVNQLAEAYLGRKQKETGLSIPHERYIHEKQKVKMYLADNNVFGVDLNPIAVELAEVSLWLNTIYEGAYVPWFGMQLATGNSLVGARRQVFSSRLLRQAKRTDPLWLDQAPARIPPGSEHPRETVYHFLLPDKGMAGYGDKVVRRMAEAEIKVINSWRKNFTRPFSSDEIEQLEKLSLAVDHLWEGHTESLRRNRKRTADPLRVFGQPEPQKKSDLTSTEWKDRILIQEVLSKEVRTSSPYRRLKLVMDYWCGLWFWPIEKADILPSRDEFLLDLSLILEGNVFERLPTEGKQQDLFPDTMPMQEAQKFIAEFGFVNVDKLCNEIPRLRLVSELAEKHRFLHWELEFADIFADMGGFDLVLGNPPWTRVRLELQKILAEFDPRIYLRNYTAADVTNQLPILVKEKPVVARELLKEATSILAMRSYMCSKDYVLSGSSNTNLYKCFIEKSFVLSSPTGMLALLHDSGIYDEPNVGQFRNLLFNHLTFSARFINQLNHFPEKALGHAGQFAITILTKKIRDVNFNCISSVFHPHTIDESFEIEAVAKPIPKLKDKSGWILRGNPQRLIHYDHSTLDFLNESIFRSDSPLSVPLLRIYAQPLLQLLRKAAKTRSLQEVFPYLRGHPIIDETTSQRLGLIIRAIERPPSISQLILSAPHFYVGSPFIKQPNEGCKSKGDYSSIDFLDISEEFLPRAIFNITSSGHHDEIVSNEELRLAINDFRFAWRNWVSPSNERTLIATIIPPEVLHVNNVFSMRFPDHKNLALFGGLSFSIVYDFFVRVTGVDHLWTNNILALPFPEALSETIKDLIIDRVLRLTCITRHYAPLWNSCSTDDSTWRRDNMYLCQKARRFALVELDVLAAMALNMSLEELLLLYSIEFPTFFENENDTYYDQNGRIVFTSNKGFSGVGFSRFEWNQIKDMSSGTVERTVIDDALGGESRERRIMYVAPFERCDRERDYEVIWAKFAHRL